MLALLASVLIGTVLLVPDCTVTLMPTETPSSAEAARRALVDAAGQLGGECLDATIEAYRAEMGYPFADSTQALVVYTGRAESVQIAGDMTGWRPAPMARVRYADVAGGESSLWLATLALPAAARVDYKLVVDGEWILDPRNAHTQAAGTGGLNSELRMPGWSLAPETLPRDGIARAELTPPDTLHSAALGAPVVVRVLVPPGVPATPLRLGAEPVAPASEGGAHGALRLVVATDGHEYADPALGALPTVLDNLRADGALADVLLVLIDPRWDGVNRRESLLVDNDGFADFVATELVPAVEAAYPVARTRDKRAILGTSLGGLFAATLGARHPDVFGNLAIQSPAFWVGAGPDAETAGFTESRFQGWTGASVYERLAGVTQPLRISMSTGTIRDTEDGARRMRDALHGGPHTLTYREVPEGHSWGQWRALVGPQLVDLFGTRE